MNKKLTSEYCREARTTRRRFVLIMSLVMMLGFVAEMVSAASHQSHQQEPATVQSSQSLVARPFHSG